jgi:hypothetical protein
MKGLTLKIGALLCTCIILTSCKKDVDQQDVDQPDVDQPVNQPPFVNAGSDQSVTLPSNATLSGSATDTDGTVVAYLWSQVSGPNTAGIANPGSATTAVGNLMKGSYLFQLMATDNSGATGVDTVSMVVTGPTVDTLTLSPANNSGEFQLALWAGQDVGSGGSVDIPIEAWTDGGSPVTVRQLLKFDLSSIPSNAVITSATLNLYSEVPPLNGNLTDPNYGSNNSMYLQQVTSAWSTSTAKWSNQPTVSTANELSIPTTSSSVLDLNLNVTDMIASMVNNNANYGFLLRLQNETMYNSRIFCSSNNADASKHPKLEVIYQVK